ncbi:MAG: histone deacetylase family protein, partial [Candidatus Lokiarchaeota archaeon]|nr:histone deacetylase family protein [Candidatus Lokiarchaeota archaeon]
ILEKGQQTVMGFALLIHFPGVRASFLDYFAVRPGQRGGGIGGSLYEAVQEHCRQVGSTTLYMDVVPDDPSLTRDPAMIGSSKKRISFYERYGARVIVNPAYAKPVGNPPSHSFLMMDRLGKSDVVPVEEVKAAITRILMRRFPGSTTPEYMLEVLEHFSQEGVMLRARLAEPGHRMRGLPPGALAKSLGIVYNPRHEIHHVQEKGYLESPVRMLAIKEAIGDKPVLDEVDARKFSDDVLLEIHDPILVHYLRTVCSQMTDENPFYPDTFPIRRLERKPRDVLQQAGYYCLDDGTPLYKGAIIGAKAALDTALTGAEQILSGKRLVYAACRPPGHHAGRRFFGGFCYFNNAAAAAQHLCQQYRTAILDIDYHHGNGTQDIFYSREDVLTISLHGDPTYSYPYFSGDAAEVGMGAGKGYNQNYPLPLGTGEHEYLAALDKALRRVRDFGVEVLVVSLGYDILKGDPTGDFDLPVESMEKIGRRLDQLQVPLLVVHEGGYHLNNIRRGCECFFEAFSGEMRPV